MYFCIWLQVTALPMWFFLYLYKHLTCSKDASFSPRLSHRLVSILCLFFNSLVRFSATSWDQSLSAILLLNKQCCASGGLLQMLLFYIKQHTVSFLPLCNHVLTWEQSTFFSRVRRFSLCPQSLIYCFSYWGMSWIKYISIFNVHFDFSEKVQYSAGSCSYVIYNYHVMIYHCFLY